MSGVVFIVPLNRNIVQYCAHQELAWDNGTRDLENAIIAQMRWKTSENYNCNRALPAREQYLGCKIAPIHPQTKVSLVNPQYPHRRRRETKEVSLPALHSVHPTAPPYLLCREEHICWHHLTVLDSGLFASQLVYILGGVSPGGRTNVFHDCRRVRKVVKDKEDRRILLGFRLLQNSPVDYGEGNPRNNYWRVLLSVLIGHTPA